MNSIADSAVPRVVQRDSRREVVLYEAASEAISLNSLAQLSRRELSLPCGNREEHDEGPESLHLMITSRCATRGKDKFITSELFDAILERLDVVAHVFSGTTFTLRAELIPMYQAVIFFEKKGHTFTSLDKGCLTPWFGQVLHESNLTGRRGFASPLARMIDIGQQQDFWEDQYPRAFEQYQHFVETREDHHSIA